MNAPSQVVSSTKAPASGQLERKPKNFNSEEEDPEIAVILVKGEWVRLKDAQGNPFYANPTKKTKTKNLRAFLGLGKKPVAASAKQPMVKASRPDITATETNDAAEDPRMARRVKRQVKEKEAEEDARKRKEEAERKRKDPVADALKSGEWKELKDPGSGKTYYHNTKTNETTWDLKEKLGVTDESPSEKLEEESDNSSSETGSDQGRRAKNNTSGGLDTLAALLAITTPNGGAGANLGGLGAALMTSQPRPPPPSEKKSDAVKQALASGDWLELTDPAGSTFFYNTKTQQSVVDLDTELAGATGTWVPIPDPNNPGGMLLFNTVSKAVKQDPRSPPVVSPKQTSQMQQAQATNPLLMNAVNGVASQHQNGAGSPLKGDDYPSSRERKKIDKLLRTGQWVMFVDPITQVTCYRNTVTGRISFDVMSSVKEDRRERRTRSRSRRRRDSSDPTRGVEDQDYNLTNVARSEQAALGPEESRLSSASAYLFQNRFSRESARESSPRRTSPQPSRASSPYRSFGVIKKNPFETNDYASITGQPITTLRRREKPLPESTKPFTAAHQRGRSQSHRKHRTFGDYSRSGPENPRGNDWFTPSRPSDQELYDCL